MNGKYLHLLTLGILLNVGVQGLSQESKDQNRLASEVHQWSQLEVETTETGKRRQILSGSTTHLASFKIHASTLNPRVEQLSDQVHSEGELLVIVKEGLLGITIEGKSEVLGPGSVALILPGDRHGFYNPRDQAVSYYVLTYSSHTPMNIERGKNEGGSFVVKWEEVAYKEHSKGGRRDFFDHPTAMAEDFEMHVTNLNEETQSHPPHTHEVEEIILMVQGHIEMHIDGKTYPAAEGDLIFLDSEVSHAPTNIGEGQCIYFAFQWK